MARKIRFPLIMKDGTEVRTIEELHESFDLEVVLGYFADGKLLTWLQNRYYDVEYEKISALNPENSSFEAQLCEALGVTFSKNNNEEFDLDYINRRNEKKGILSQLTTDEELLKNIDYVALNQEDLIDCFDIGAKTIYLVGETVFTIPLSVTGITYIGHSNAKAVIRATDNVNFKEKNITFRDIQFSWDTSVITPNDKVYQAEQMLARGQASEAISLLEAVAESNHPRALLILGNYYSDNDTEKAQEYYKRAADLGYDEANSLVGTPENNMSQNDISKTAAHDSTELLYWKAIHNQFYSSFTRHRKRVIDYFEEAAKKGHEASFVHLKYKGMKSYDAESWLKKEANNNNTEAQYILGIGYRRGKWITRKSDFDKYRCDKAAKPWLEEAANNGHIPAQYELGCWYASHYGTVTLLFGVQGYEPKSDYENAMIWINKAAESNFPDALLRLGNIYSTGSLGMKKIPETAFKYYLKAAEYGLEKAQYEVGDRYHHGIGIEQDIAKAIEWYKKSQSYYQSRDALEELGIIEEED